MILNTRLSVISFFTLFTSTQAIVGGRNASQNEFPCLVWFEVGSRFCSGSLIDLNIVLTSASCVEGHDDFITVIAGDHLLFEEDGTEQTRLSQAVILHEKFNSSGNLNDDISLIRLAAAFQLTDGVQPVKLASADHEPENAGYGFAVGWGETTIVVGQNDTILIDPGISSILLRAEVIITKASTCNGLHGSEIPGDQFCTHGKGGSQSDRGGPLFCNEVKNTTCGILSSTWVDQSGFKNAVAGYIQVSNYLEWIEEHKNPSTYTPTVSTTSSSLKTSPGESSTTNEKEIRTSTIPSWSDCLPNEPTSITYLALLITLCIILTLSCGALTYKLIATQTVSNRERIGGYFSDETNKQKV